MKTTESKTNPELELSLARSLLIFVAAVIGMVLIAIFSGTSWQFWVTFAIVGITVRCMFRYTLGINKPEDKQKQHTTMRGRIMDISAEIKKSVDSGILTGLREVGLEDSPQNRIIVMRKVYSELSKGEADPITMLFLAEIRDRINEFERSISN